MALLAKGQITIINQIDGTSPIMAVIESSAGENFKNGVVRTTLRAKVLMGMEDVTSSLPSSAFVWTRTTGDAASDAAWKASHLNIGAQIEVFSTDVKSKAVFEVIISTKSIFDWYDPLSWESGSSWPEKPY